MKNVVLLGSTGSIGTSTIKVAEDLPNAFRLVGLAAGNNVELAARTDPAHMPEMRLHQDPEKPESCQSPITVRATRSSFAGRRV